MNKKKIIVYLYNSLNDPLITGNIFLYLKDAAKSGKYEFYVITYEQEQFKMDLESRKMKIEELGSLHIHWKGYNWSTGSKLKKAVDLLKAMGFVFYLKVFRGYQSIISLASVAGVYAYIYSLLFRLKLYLYQYEPHSEYGIDAKMWKTNSITFKILHKLEYRSAMHATVISSGTEFMMERLKGWGARAKLLKIPSVVNHNKFIYDPQSRLEIRKKLKLSQKDHLVIYPGKFGDLYYNDEIGVLFKSLADKSPHYYFVILTLTDKQMAVSAMEKNGLPKNRYVIGSATYSEMPKYLSAADIGIVAVPPQPSKKFCSNIKVGEYLCSGLPYLICEGVSEDDKFARSTNTGVTIKEFSYQEGEFAHQQITKLLNEKKNKIVDRCRNAGIEYRSFEFLNPKFREALETL